MIFAIFIGRWVPLAMSKMRIIYDADTVIFFPGKRKREGGNVLTTEQVNSDRFHSKEKRHGLESRRGDDVVASQREADQEKR